MRTLTIGVDLDGCVYRFVDAMRTFAHRHDGLDLASMPTARRWDAMTTDWGWSPDEFADRYRRALHAGELFWRGAAYPGALHTLAALSRAGHRIEVVTARVLDECDADLVRAATERWLADHGVAHDALWLCADKAHHEVDCFIEDSPDNVAALERAGRHPLLIDRPWNRTAPVRRRVTGWHHAHRTITALAAA